jgi:hypothetical protein
MHRSRPGDTGQGGNHTGGKPEAIVSGVPDFGSLSFEDAVRLFKEWGFIVEPGPRPEEVTLLLEGPDYRTYSVTDAHELPELAAAALRIRWQNGMLMCQRQEGDAKRRSTGQELVESIC